MNRITLAFQTIATGIVLMAFSLAALAAPKADLWPRWQQNDASSEAEIDHSAWTKILRKSTEFDATTKLNRFRYAGVSTSDRKALDNYIDMLQGTAISAYNRDEQKAFWINLYNATTVKVVLDHYPVDSIFDINISPGFFSKGPWGKALLSVEGQPLSLDDIEHRILRPIWKDPLVHYTVNCASVGCPNLANEAYTAANTAALAEAGARAYINSPRGVLVDGNRLKVSSIYVWFGDDFGGSDSKIINHLKMYAEPALAKTLGSVKSISGNFYDWDLNGTL